MGVKAVGGNAETSITTVVTCPSCQQAKQPSKEVLDKLKTSTLTALKEQNVDPEVWLGKYHFALLKAGLEKNATLQQISDKFDEVVNNSETQDENSPEALELEDCYLMRKHFLKA